MVNPITTEGDLIVGSESRAAMRLGKGSDGQVLKSTNTLEGVKVGDNLTITNGVLPPMTNPIPYPPLRRICRGQKKSPDLPRFLYLAFFRETAFCQHRIRRI
jgi:hypothetical protein